ncbi:MAG: hypothetical protein M3Y59_19215 [Myxococcota bacterium]|nr:hypothetical protein [Myxococcota bacterium]
MKRSPPPRGHFLIGFVATLGFAVAGLLLYAAYLLYFQEPPVAPPPPRRASAVRPTLGGRAVISSGGPGELSAQDRQALLASQSAHKRNQILVVDAYLQILGRYPNAREQAAWLPIDSPAAKTLAQLRKSGQDDEVISRHISGQLLESAASARFPSLRKVARADSTGDDAGVIAALLARALGADLGTGDEGTLIRQLQRTYGLAEDEPTPLASVTAMLRDLTGSSDVTEHFLEEGTPLEVEVEAIRTVLRTGRLVVISGADAPTHGRLVLAVGHDAQGTILVRDPRGRMPERAGTSMLKAFLTRPGLVGAAGTPGLWIELPARRGRCRPNVQLAGLPTGLDSLVLGGEGGLTGTIPGAQVNLTSIRIPEGEHTVKGTLSLTAEQIDRILAEGKSPAVGSGDSFVKWGRHYNIDPAWALAFFRRESWYGAHKRWVGRISDTQTSRNIGNIRYTGRPSPQRVPQYREFNGFRAYERWDDGIHDWFRLLAHDPNYAALHTVERILPIYAPSFENDTDNYLRDVVAWVTAWRGENRVALSTQQVRPAAALQTPDCDD